MRTIVAYLPAVACAAMLLFMCIPMMRNMHKDERSEDAETRTELAQLRDEISRLKAGRSSVGVDASADV